MLKHLYYDYFHLNEFGINYSSLLLHNEVL